MAEYLTKEELSRVVYENKVKNGIENVPVHHFAYSRIIQPVTIDEKTGKPKRELNPLYRDENFKRIKYTINKELGIMFLLLVDGVALKNNFRNYTYIEDMKAAGVMRLLEGWHQAKNDGNHFNYYTTIVTNRFKRFITNEHRQRDLKDELRMNNGLNTSNHHTNNHKEQNNEYNNNRATTNGDLVRPSKR